MARGDFAEVQLLGKARGRERERELVAMQGDFAKARKRESS